MEMYAVIALLCQAGTDGLTTTYIQKAQLSCAQKILNCVDIPANFGIITDNKFKSCLNPKVLD